MKAGRIALSVLLTMQAACAQMPIRSGVADRDPLRRAVVDDVATVLSEVFDAGATPLALSWSANGAFDNALLAALRGKGFVVSTMGGRGEAFDCRVDIVEGSLYQVTARVGTTVLSRLWVFDGSQAYSGGVWARRE